MELVMWCKCKNVLFYKSCSVKSVVLCKESHKNMSLLIDNLPCNHNLCQKFISTGICSEMYVQVCFGSFVEMYSCISKGCVQKSPTTTTVALSICLSLLPEFCIIFYRLYSSSDRKSVGGQGEVTQLQSSQPSSLCNAQRPTAVTH